MLNKIKDNIVMLFSSRLLIFGLVVVVLFSVLAARLFNLQIVNGQEYLDNFLLKTKKTITTEGSRGTIYDVNGNVLAYNKLAYTVVMENSEEFSKLARKNDTTPNYERNKMIHNLIQVIEENGDEIVNEFPITIGSNGNLKFTVTGSALTRFLKDVYSITKVENYEGDDRVKVEKLLKNNVDEVFEFLCTGKGGLSGSGKMFEIDESYELEDALKIAAVRYSIYMNRYSQMNPVTVANDVSEQTLIDITENPEMFPGVSVETDSLRVYNDSKYFAHLIGYTGTVSTTEMEEKNEGLTEDDPGYYSSNDTIGKSGVEQLMETYLRGTKGTKEIYVDNLGKILQVASSTEASAGNNVTLTIDAELQKYAYNVLERRLAGILLAKLTTASDGGNDKLIPINDVYFALIDNNIIDIEELSADNATDHEKAVYRQYESKKGQIISRIKKQLNNGTIQRDLSEEMQEYMLAVYSMLSSQGILNSNLINTSDNTYLDWKNDRIALEDFLRYAVNKEWIDISELEMESAYYDTAEMYEALVEYIARELEHQPDFDKLLYKYMIKSGILSGRQVCLLLYEQDVLSKEDSDYSQLAGSAINSYEFIRRKIQKLEITPAMLALDPCSGSIVITDVNTGEVRALVSYPSYDNNKLANGIDAEYYATLVTDKTNPLYNRATQQKTAPGSTYKPLVSIAGMEEGYIDGYSIIDTRGIFTTISPPAKCWHYPSSHGKINVQTAIGVSCNYFFYELGYRMGLTNGKYNSEQGLSTIAKYAGMFGFDRKSGIELPETAPSISDTDAVRSAIGQGTNSYTPSQISRYATALASQGDLYNLSILDNVTDSEGTMIKEYTPELLEHLDIADSTWSAVKNGMYEVVYGSRSSIDHLYAPLGSNKIAGKTGTAQENTKRPNHALFVSYGPYENPEISVTTVIPFGYTSSYAAETARDVYKYYFGLLTEEEKNATTALLPSSGAVSND